MKTLKYSFGLLAMAVIFLSSCRDFVEPNVPYKDFDTGAYLRTISRTSTTFNFFDLANSKFALTLEAVDKEDGKTVLRQEAQFAPRGLGGQLYWYAVLPFHIFIFPTMMRNIIKSAKRQSRSNA